MKKLNRQSVMVLGAGVCLLIAGYSLFTGNEPPSAPVDAPAPPAEASPGTSSAAPAASLAPEVYQQIRAQLLQFRAEHTEPFVSEAATAGLVATTATPSESSPRGKWEPPKEITVPPVFVAPPEVRRDQGEIEKPVSEPLSSNDASRTEAAALTPPRLRGQIRTRQNGRITAILEWNGRLVRATNAPDAEWRILEITPHAIIVRYGEQTFTVEVSHAK